MTLLLLFIIALLIVLNLMQYTSRRNHAEQMKYMTDKLTFIMDESSQEQLLLMTDDLAVRHLLNAINRLLDQNRESVVNFTRTELAMRRMLANISHDLKTPLTVVLGYIETMINQPDIPDAEQDRLLSKVHMKAMEIVELINRFFDLAKLESGDKELPMTRVHMNEICRNNMLMFYDLIQSSGLEAVIEVPDTELYAWGNEEALDRVLNNVLTNAIRYGADGKMVGLTLRSSEDQVFIDVWDKGKGISEREQPLIFERMYTLEDSRNKSFQGSGLGLTITKRLIEQLGGEIRVSSTPFKRTVFTISLRRLS